MPGTIDTLDYEHVAIGPRIKYIFAMLWIRRNLLSDFFGLFFRNVFYRQTFSEKNENDEGEG